MVSPTPSPLCNGVFHMVLYRIHSQRCFEMVESSHLLGGHSSYPWKKTLKLRCLKADTNATALPMGAHD